MRVCFFLQTGDAAQIPEPPHNSVSGSLRTPPCLGSRSRRITSEADSSFVFPPALTDIHIDPAFHADDIVGRPVFGRGFFYRIREPRLRRFSRRRDGRLGYAGSPLRVPWRFGEVTGPELECSRERPRELRSFCSRPGARDGITHRRSRRGVQPVRRD